MSVAISVLVPVYNVEKYLTRCIESVLNNTDFPYRLILIDDIIKEVIAYYYLLIVIYINAWHGVVPVKTSLIQKGLKLWKINQIHLQRL